MYSLPGTLQPISNQVVGTVVAAVLKAQVYKRATPPPQPGEFTPPSFHLNYMVPMVRITALTQEVYEAHAEVTQHAVEDGTPFSDHVILRPLRFEMSFEVSNYDGLGSDAQLAKKALDNMLQVWRNRRLFSLLTTHRLLENVVCLSLQVTNDAPEWGRLTFRATFQEVKLVTLQSAAFPKERVQGVSAVGSAGLSQPNGPTTPLSAQTASSPVKKPVKTSTTPKGVFDQALGLQLPQIGVR